MHKKIKHIGIAVGLIIALAVGAFIFLTPAPAAHGYHVHADFAVYLDGEKMDFAQEKYMSEKAPGKTLAQYVHLHDGKGNIIHFHAPRITLGDFFESIGMRFDANCFTTDTNAMYCKDGFIQGNVPGNHCYLNDANQRICTQNEEIKTLKLYVNGQPADDYGNYVPQDLDRILISYGNEDADALHQQINSITDEACIQSLKCPERGSPAPEDGCDATDSCVFDIDSLR